MAPVMAKGTIGAIIPLYIPPPAVLPGFTVQGSMREPPQELAIRPIGTLRSVCNFRPK